MNSSPTYLSEIFPLSINEPNLTAFRLTPEIDREIGNRLSYHFSRQFPDVTLTWFDKTFWALGKLGKSMPTPQEWKAALKNIQKEVKDLRGSYWSFQWLHQPVATPQILAQLAYSILTKERPFSSEVVFEKQNIEVRREVRFWAETIELKGVLYPAFALTNRSPISYQYSLTLEDFYENHPFRQDPNLLIGLKVRDIDKGSTATIVQLAGTVGEYYEELIENATGSTSRQALQDTFINNPSQPLVSVKFKSQGKAFSYAMAALRPIVTAETADKFEVEYGEFLSHAKISYEERQALLGTYRKEIVKKKTLSQYGFVIADKCINSKEYPNLFWTPQHKLDETLLLFGKGYKGVQGQILKGLNKRQGGVYKRHENYKNYNTPITISALKLTDQKLKIFLDKVIEFLDQYGFKAQVINHKSLIFSDQNKANQKRTVKQAIYELAEEEPDIILAFLPTEDRYDDYTEEGSFYQQIYSILLNRRIASQFVYQDTLKDLSKLKYILWQIIPGILAKLGNIPFVLAEPLDIADYFIGLDISRKPKDNLSGTMNACASVRLYGNNGEFEGYRLEGESTQGEEISAKLLEKMLPEQQLKNKTVLIYRDGKFVKKEVKNLLAIAQSINAKFILVECRKSQVPRLYNLNQSKIQAPTQGLALRLSPNEAIVVTTKLDSRQQKDNRGVPRPLRLNIHPDGHPATIESVVDTTLKLTLLHHGALKTPRLPMPLHGADRMAYLRLNGIYPSFLEGDRQFWL
ncbi:MAG: Piwi domain-containing protein [Microcystaceae cyanobacterium]